MVPNYKDMMFLILKFIYKNTRVTLREVYGEAYGFLIKDFCCKPDELKRVVTNGKFVYEDRASWALTYLKYLKILEKIIKIRV